MIISSGDLGYLRISLTIHNLNHWRPNPVLNPITNPVPFTSLATTFVVRCSSRYAQRSEQQSTADVDSNHGMITGITSVNCTVGYEQSSIERHFLSRQPFSEPLPSVYGGGNVVSCESRLQLQSLRSERIRNQRRGIGYSIDDGHITGANYA